MFGTTALRRRATGANLRRRLLGTVAAVALGAASLTGCAAGMISQTADQVPNHDGVHGTAGAIAVSNAILGDSSDTAGPVAFAAGSAVPLTLWVTNTSLDADTLTSISSSAGAVTVTGDAVIPGKGALEIGGDSPVTATIDAASSDVIYGAAVTVDFYFATAGKITLKVPVAIPAERSADRGSTDIHPAEEHTIWSDTDAQQD